jgi:hypothetical protein
MSETAEQVVAEVQQKAAKTSILDGMKPTQKSQPEPLTDVPAWNIMEGLPGSGPRPDWLLPKYATPFDQAKAYPELEKKFGNRDVAPEKYEFGETSIELEDPTIQEYIGWAKEKNLSQDVVGTTVEKFAKYLKSKQPDLDKEIEKLGPDANQKIETIRRWAENNFSENSLKVIGSISKSADAINFLDELRQYQYHNETQIPSGNANSSTFVKLTKQEVEDKMRSNFKQYNEDATFRAEITKMFEQAMG